MESEFQRSCNHSWEEWSSFLITKRPQQTSWIRKRKKTKKKKRREEKDNKRRMRKRKKERRKRKRKSDY